MQRDRIRNTGRNALDAFIIINCALTNDKASGDTVTPTKDIHIRVQQLPKRVPRIAQPN